MTFFRGVTWDVGQGLQVELWEGLRFVEALCLCGGTVPWLFLQGWVEGTGQEGREAPAFIALRTVRTCRKAAVFYSCISQGCALIKWCCVYISRRVLNFHISSISHREHPVLTEEGNTLPWPKYLRIEN